MFAVHSSIFSVLSCDVSIDKTSSVIAPLKLHIRFKYCFLQEANLPAVSKETFVLPQFFFSYEITVIALDWNSQMFLKIL